MIRVIYADILFLINLIINYLLLFASSRISSLPMQRIRLLLSASAGGIFSVLFLLPGFSFFSTIPAKILLSLIMVFTAFGKTRFIQAYLTFIAVSLLFGGTAFLSAYLFPDTFSEVSDGIYYINLSIPALLASSFLSFVILNIIFSRRGGRASKMLCTVHIKNLGKEISLPTLIDTGNSLSDPGSGARILISDLDSLRDILPDGSLPVLNAGKGAPFALVLDRLSDFPEFRLIPYKTVGVPFSLLLAYRPEEIVLEGRILKNALCAISETPVSDGSGYVALI